MAVRPILFLGVALAIVLLVSQDTAHARELTEANDLKGNVQPATTPHGGVMDKKTYIGVEIPRQPTGIAAGYYGGAYQPYVGGIGVPIGYGYGGGYVNGPGIFPGPINTGFGGGYGGGLGFFGGVPGF